MLFLDYHLDIERGRYIILDNEITKDKLGLKEGEMLQVCQTEMGVMLKRIDPVVAFANGFAVNAKPD